MVSLKLNGRQIVVPSSLDTPLLWVIRDDAGLTGTKFGCGIGQCGACTVHIDGKAVRSCITPLSAATGKAITTIEGLDPAGAHPLQTAWIEVQAPQCGYCQSGQIMQAASLLSDNPHPTDEEIVHGMNGNLCRCMAYVRIKAAIKLASSKKPASAKKEGASA